MKSKRDCRKKEKLTDLSKAFDCLPHNLLISKLHAYGFENKAVRFVYDYLTSRNQRIKISDIYSPWRDILLGVPQSSILGLLLFNIDICDLFFIIGDCDIANYADDNVPYLTGEKCRESFEQFRMCCQTCFHGLLRRNWKEMHANVIYW